jgi:alkylation response protein AidB-like acyl-CoA dehydrogenase
MLTYQAPTRDFEFVLNELLDWNRISSLPGYEHANRETVSAVLNQAGRFCSNILLPLNRSGDEEGCTYENGVVRPPKGFKEAYRSYVEAGWPAVSAAEEDDGQALPYSIHLCVEEMMTSTNMAFGNYSGLTHGAYKVIREHGSKDQKKKFLSKLATGVWTGTMCLTEAHCGTDLGLLRTKAVPGEKGSYRITGEKIFISSGEHDLSENIVHLVLARLPDAPPGVKGISLFIVPKFLVGEDGRPGVQNAVRCSGIEHKMGIRAAATCVMNFENAEGYLIGEPHKGVRNMFTMMNLMRILIGVQGVGFAEGSYQAARHYAKERLQSRATSGTKYPDKPADPIIVHPDVRKMLMTMRALAEGCRALTLWTASFIDIAEKHPDPKARAEAEEMRAFLTPIVKAFNTDSGYEAANWGVAIYGGHGFIREHGMEQFVRDAKITQLYEGTNGIQSLDLAARKLSANNGRAVKEFSRLIDSYLASRLPDNKTSYVAALARAFEDFNGATKHILDNLSSNPDEVAAAATDYLRLTGLVALAYLFARSADIAASTDLSDSFYRGKIVLADFFATKILPQTGSLLESIEAGARPLMALAADEF